MCCVIIPVCVVLHLLLLLFGVIFHIVFVLFWCVFDFVFNFLCVPLFDGIMIPTVRRVVCVPFVVCKFDIILIYCVVVCVCVWPHLFSLSLCCM